MKNPRIARDRVLLLGIFLTIFVWLANVWYWLDYYDDLTGRWWLLLVIFAPPGIVYFLFNMWEAETQRMHEEQRKAERQAGNQAERRRTTEEQERLREREAQAKQEEAQAYRREVERFHAERLSIERFVVGDEQAGIRSPYEVEMTDAEKALLDTISSKFDPSCLLVDTYLDKGDGTTTQVDIIAICRQGVIAIESKGLGGTMSGKWDDKEWIQQPSQRRIYNPLKQNDLHLESIRRVLEPNAAQREAAEQLPVDEVLDRWYADEPLRYRAVFADTDLPLLLVADKDADTDNEVAYSVVAFGDGGSADLKFLPDCLYSLVVFNQGATFPDLKLYSSMCQVAAAHRVNEAINRILSEDEVLTDAEVMELAYKIRKHRIVPTKEVREAHIRNIQVVTGRAGVLE